MPKLILTTPVSTAEATRRAKTLEDEYGYRERLRCYSVEELIAAFNREVGNPGWVRARGVFLTALHDALLATGLDCSSFISSGGMSLDQEIERRDDALGPTRSRRREPMRPVVEARTINDRDAEGSEDNTCGLCHYGKGRTSRGHGIARDNHRRMAAKLDARGNHQRAERHRAAAKWHQAEIER